MEGITEGDLLEELSNQMPQPLRDKDVTASRLAEKRGCSVSTARRFLNKQVKNGLLEKFEALGKSFEIVYRRPQKRGIISKKKGGE